MQGISIQLALGGMGKASDKKLAERYKKKFNPDPSTTTVNSTAAEDEMDILPTGAPNGGPRNPEEESIMKEIEALSQMDLGQEPQASMLKDDDEEEK